MERNKNKQWHYDQNVRLSRLASRMAILFTPGYDKEQPPAYTQLQQEYLWQQHVKAEHDKFDPPFYSDHRFG